jgi:hypothetical protein
MIIGTLSLYDYSGCFPKTHLTSRTMSDPPEVSVPLNRTSNVLTVSGNMDLIRVQADLLLSMSEARKRDVILYNLGSRVRLYLYISDVDGHWV